ncbi:MAG TPA: ABC transporter substrate-binding protein [Syntrophobacteraceae bacterium]|nr:ABC transporter substrate-binding protein [Syntrophobacteraceae bacterium]
MVLVTRHVRSSLVAFITCLLLFCCSKTDSTPPSKPSPSKPQPCIGGVYRSPLLNSPASLDPVYVEDIYGITVVNQLFDGLVRFNAELLITPALAENWQIEEGGKVYRFFLRENARFHNGLPVTSRDVVFSLRRLIAARPAPSILPHLLRIVGAVEFREHGGIDLPGVYSNGDREVVVRLEEPYVPFLAAMGMHQTKVVPENEVTRSEMGFGRHPIGSGPFSFVSWEDNVIRLGRFPDYYGGPAYLDGLQFVIYPGGKIEEALGDFQGRRLHDLPVLGKVRQALAAQTDLVRLHRPSLSLLFYGINCENGLLREVRLRKALSLAIDRQKLAQTVYQGQFEPMECLLPPGMPGYSPDRKKVLDDPAAAEKELDDSLRERISMAPALEIVSAVQSPIAKGEIEFVSNCWATLGIRVEPKFILDWAKFQEYLRTDAVQVYRYAWFVDLPDADNVFQSLFGSDSKNNFMRFRSGSLDQMLGLARRSLLPTERQAIYQGIEDQVLMAQPLIPLVHLSVDHVYHTNVHGIQLSALGDHATRFHQVWLDQPTEPGN